jgi:predicted amidohydrolase
MDLSSQAAKDGANFVAFPELALTGFVCGKKVFEHAEPIEGPTTEKLTKLSKDKNIDILFGMPELNGSLVHNSAVLIEPNGVLGVYRKLYLVTFEYAGVRYEEHLFLKPGFDIKVFDTRFGKMGVEICYDIWFPEIPRCCALQGAWLMFNISAAPFGVPELFQLLARARAVENQGFFAYVNEIGPQEGVVFTGGSCIVDNTATIIESAHYGENLKDEIIQKELNPDIITKARLDLPLLRDVRPEILRRVADIAESLYFPPRG